MRGISTSCSPFTDKKVTRHGFCPDSVHISNKHIVSRSLELNSLLFSAFGVKCYPIYKEKYSSLFYIWFKYISLITKRKIVLRKI